MFLGVEWIEGADTGRGAAVDTGGVAASSGKRKVSAAISRGICWREAWRISVRA